MKQEAIITKIEGDTITAQITCADACKSCKAASMCGTDKQKTITLVEVDTQRAVGDHISLELERGAGLRAVAVAYLVPVALAIALLLVMQALGVSDMVAGLSALGLIVVYYILIKVLGLGAGVSVTIVE